MKMFPGVLRAGIAALVIALGSQSVSFADRHHGRDDRPHHWHDRGFRCSILPTTIFTLALAGITYFYDDGVFYVRDGAEYVVIDPPVGAVVQRVPSYYDVLVVNGVRYFRANGIYYVRVRGGYQVVSDPVVVVRPAPVVVTAPPAVQAAPATTVIVPTTAPVQTVSPAAVTAVVSGEEESFIVNIPNDAGNYTPVTLKRQKDGFVGPQGEFYPEFPRVAQLKVMYGKTTQ